MILSNYHSHTHYCDGTDSPETYVKKALELGLKAYGFSSHAPIPYPVVKWCMKMDRRRDYVHEIRQLQTKYAGEIELYCSMEVDFIPDEMGCSAPWIKELGLDYTISSVHFVGFEEAGVPWEIDGTHEGFKRGLTQLFGGDVNKAVTRYFEITRTMLEKDCPSVLGHMDKIKMHNSDFRYFEEDESWYRNQVMETLELARSKQVLIEVNTRGIYKKKTTEPYPSPWILKEMKKLGIQVVVNSDGHHPTELIACFEQAYAHLRQAGYTESFHFLNGEWKAEGI